MTLEANMFGEGAPDADKPIAQKTLKRKGDVLPVYEAPSVKLFRPGKRSSIENHDLALLWQYLQQAHPVGYPHNSELCSQKSTVRGVGISRWAESMKNWIEDFLSNAAYRGLLKDKYYEEIKKECENLLPHFKILDGTGLPAIDDNSQNGRAMKSLHRNSQPIWRDPEEVRKAADAILAWLKDCKTSKLRGAIKVFSAGGLSWSAYCDTTMVQAYYHHGNGDRDLHTATRQRLCQGNHAASSTPNSAEDLSQLFTT